MFWVSHVCCNAIVCVEFLQRCVNIYEYFHSTLSEEKEFGSVRRRANSSFGTPYWKMIFTPTFWSRVYFRVPNVSRYSGNACDNLRHDSGDLILQKYFVCPSLLLLTYHPPSRSRISCPLTLPYRHPAPKGSAVEDSKLLLHHHIDL